MSVIKGKNGKWLCQIHKKGLRRVRRSFNSLKEAEIFEREYLLTVKKTHVQISDPRTLIELINIWYKYHGVNLSNPEKFKRQMDVAAYDLGNPVAHMLTPELFVKYRYERTVLQDNAITAKTFNNLHGLLSAMFNRLKKLKIINYENPIIDVDKLKFQEKQMSYLSVAQIDELLYSIESRCKNPCTWYVVNICVRTGARWSEAQNIKKQQLHDGMVTFVNTKSKKTRTIQLDKAFYNSLLIFCKSKEPNERIFTNCIGSYRKAIERTSIQLPAGQLSHVLRHSFAAHFLMNKGDILTLQQILGHSDIKMTMKYAHLSPSHLKDAVTKNPLA